MINKEVLESWEAEQQAMEHYRYCPEKTKRPYDPKKERLKKRNRREKSYRWDKENYWYARMHKKHIRAKYKLIEGEDVLHPAKREYHTYGWLTW